MQNQKPKTQKINGICALCGSSFSKSAMKKHLESCIKKHPPAKQTDSLVPQKRFIILVEGIFLHEYWMYLDVPTNSLLQRLDNFLRDTWVECCRHLSDFAIDGESYISETDEYFKKDKSMDYIMNRILSVGKKFTYRYDFGSSTYLDLKVISEHEVEVENSSIVLLARNESPQVLCDSCGKTAAYICRQCGYSGNLWVCEDCAPDHECGEEMLLPVVNSPRVGVCGYTGLD